MIEYYQFVKILKKQKQNKSLERIANFHYNHTPNLIYRFMFITNWTVFAEVELSKYKSISIHLVVVTIIFYAHIYN